MKNATAMVVMIVCGLLSVSLDAAAQDAAGCQDHPLIPRAAGYVILGCSADDAMADVEIVTGETTETIHVEGKSTALLYRVDPALETTEAQVRDHFTSVIGALGGSLLGVTFGQEWPVYAMAADGKEYWVVLMIKSGEYFTGSYTYRIIEKPATMPD